MDGVMKQPQVGDIWRWDGMWHVLVLEETDSTCFLGLCLEDGEIDTWYFDEYNRKWEQSA